VRQREPRASKQGQRKPKERREFLHASPKPQDFLLEFRRSQVRHVEANDDVWRFVELPTRGRARDSEIRGDTYVARASDEIPKPVVVAPLRSGRTRHAHDHLPFADAVQLLDACGRPPT
jgi:hypothetical protein